MNTVIKCDGASHMCRKQYSASEMKKREPMLRHRQMTPLAAKISDTVGAAKSALLFTYVMLFVSFLLLIYYVNATNDTQIERNTARWFVVVCRGKKNKKGESEPTEY